jgi:glutamate-1-semialdehyde 2,1-aminomutase
MLHFLRALDTAAVRAVYEGLDERFHGAADRLNQRLRDAGIPVQVAAMSSVWTIMFEKPSRYNWMLQFYLREAGLALSWVGSGRLIFSLNYSDEHLNAVFDRFVDACLAMRNEAWWESPVELSNKSIRRRILKEMFEHKA